MLFEKIIYKQKIMKQNYALIFLITFLIFSLRPLNAQNQTQIEEIKRKTNLQELQKLETKFKSPTNRAEKKSLRTCTD